MSMDSPSTARGSTDTRPSWVVARNQATPPSRRASERRSETESKNAPRGDAVPDALATAPSSRSGTAQSTSSRSPRSRAPAPIATAALAAMSTPMPVRWSAVRPVRRMLSPTGRSRTSTCERKFLSNMSDRDGTGSHPRQTPSGRSTVLAPGSRVRRTREGVAVQRYAPDRIRNVALVGHHGSGKTTLAEALLHTAGAIPRRGRVEDGTTTCDHEPEERDRGMSLSLALAPLEWRDHKINLIDCPGEADCAGAVHAALSVADLAVIVVSAVEGLESQTEAVWELAASMGVPRMVFVNKLDRERADFDRVLAQLRDRFGSGFAPLELPI